MDLFRWWNKENEALKPSQRLEVWWRVSPVGNSAKPENKTTNRGSILDLEEGKLWRNNRFVERQAAVMRSNSPEKVEMVHYLGVGRLYLSTSWRKSDLTLPLWIVIVCYLCQSRVVSVGDAFVVDLDNCLGEGFFGKIFLGRQKQGGDG